MTDDENEETALQTDTSLKYFMAIVSANEDHPKLKVPSVNTEQNISKEMEVGPVVLENTSDMSKSSFPLINIHKFDATNSSTLSSCSAQSTSSGTPNTFVHPTSSHQLVSSSATNYSDLSTFPAQIDPISPTLSTSSSRSTRKRRVIPKKTATTKKKKPTESSPKPTWTKKKFSCNIISADARGELDVQQVLTPLQYFKTYFSDNFFKNTSQCTNMYCLSRYGKELNTSELEIKQLYGIHLLMGCLKYPRLRMYWQSGIELRPISQTMTRDRFFLLRNSLHVVDVNSPPLVRDRLWKVQPVLDAVREGCQKIEKVTGNYSVDEQMIPFTGRTSLKQFVPNKPRPVGLKNFVVTTSEGIMVDFQLYQGEQTNLPMKKEMGLGPSVVLKLKESVPPHSVLYFDRYFTTVKLIEKLFGEKYYATGTLMYNRLQNIIFSPDKDFKRGQYEELCSPDGKMVAIKWKDNSSVVMLSSVCGSEPVTLVKRWSKSEDLFIDVECPAAIVTYNKNMGGVDLLNQLMEVYRTWFKTKKWTLKVIIHFLDLAVVNSFFQYRRDCRILKISKKNTMDLLKFRMDLAEVLMDGPVGDRLQNVPFSGFQEKKPQNWRAPIPGEDKRTDGYDHWPVVDSLTTARACRLRGCKSRSRVRCEKCNLYLCLTKEKNCFKKFHQ